MAEIILGKDTTELEKYTDVTLIKLLQFACGKEEEVAICPTCETIFIKRKNMFQCIECDGTLGRRKALALEYRLKHENKKRSNENGQH